MLRLCWELWLSKYKHGGSSDKETLANDFGGIDHELLPVEHAQSTVATDICAQHMTADYTSCDLSP